MRVAQGVMAAVLAGAMLAGCVGFGGNCSGAQGATGAGYGQQGVCNSPDHFAYGLQGTKTGAERFDWQNGGTAAYVQWGAQGAGGVTVSITDNAGAQVFAQSFSGGQSGGQQRTSSGQAGTWHITLDWQGFSGQGGLSIGRA
jgi:hypothetical protein